MIATTYLDSSALVKLAVREPESDALRHHLRRRRPWVSSALARVEVPRALAAAGPDAVAVGHKVLARCELVRITNDLLDAAGRLTPGDLRSLDAIHLATAQRLGSDLSTFITYDQRLEAAARHHAIRVSAPR